MFASASRTSLAVFGGSIGAWSGCEGSAALRPCLEPIFAASSGSKCRAHFSAPVTAHAPHRSPFLFFAEHRLDIVQVLVISRSSPLNGGVDRAVRSVDRAEAEERVPACPILSCKHFAHKIFRVCKGNPLKRQVVSLVDYSPEKAALKNLRNNARKCGPTTVVRLWSNRVALESFQ
jgi:hypothetical protein